MQVLHLAKSYILAAAGVVMAKGWFDAQLIKNLSEFDAVGLEMGYKLYNEWLRDALLLTERVDACQGNLTRKQNCRRATAGNRMAIIFLALVRMRPFHHPFL